ncbi:MAG: 50S ribosomal protein L18 [Chitinivibrionales bacterium]|nr:50S ribosomal protein L18 [Chitinivibrionales bacterium]
MDRAKLRCDERKRRAARVRKKIVGTAERPRLSVRRSLKHISAQLVDDTTGRSIVQLTSAAKAVREKAAAADSAHKNDVSRIVGSLLAEKAKEQGVEHVVFDRKGYPYHGRVKALAEGAREGGLVF